MMIYLWLIVFSFIGDLSTQVVQLSIENSTESEYVGYVWANSKFVFLNPKLKATALKGNSVSEKICGFELTSTPLKSVPFMVYLVDELSGLGEIQVKPHIEFDYQKETVMIFTVDAYDCDMLPHYSNRINVVIHIFNIFGPRFDRNAYSFSIKKNADFGKIVGKINAKGFEKGKIHYSIFDVGTLPFEINEFSGIIRTVSTLESLNTSLIYFRVVATEQSDKIPRQSIVSVTVEIIPICKNKLTGIPDQLDYKIRNSSNGLMESERLIQDQHQPKLEFCEISSPFKEMKLVISLIQSQGFLAGSNSIKICQTDIAASRIQRGLCNANPKTIDLFLNQGGIIKLDDQPRTLGPELISLIKDEFTLLWWMKRKSKIQTTIFCFVKEDFNEVISVDIMDCKLIITISGEIIEFIIPAEDCVLKTWVHYSISLEWKMKSFIDVTVAGRTLSTISFKYNNFNKNPLRFFVGQCPSSTTKHKNQFNLNRLQIGVISLLMNKSLTKETVGCMSTCGEALVASDSIKKLSDVSLERLGNSLHFKSTKIPEIIKVLSKVDYINSYYSSNVKQSSEKEITHVAIDAFIACKSGEVVKVPRTLIKVNVVIPQKEPTNDIIEVDIYATSTIFTKKSKSIQLFPDIRFVNSITEEPVKRDVKIEVCSIRPLQRNFIGGEKIYLAHVMIPLVMTYNLKIKYDAVSWTLEGEGIAEVYENLLRRVSFDMVNERRKLFIICTLKSGELTSQAFVDVIMKKKNKISIINEDTLMNFDHNARNERKQMLERDGKNFADNFDITKSKFIAIVIMAVVGGATWAVITVAISCFIIRRRGNLMTRNRIKLNDVKSYQRESSPTFHARPTLGYNPRNVCAHYEEEEDRVSMADLPDADEHCLDNISCDTCNMTDHENTFNNINSNKDIPRSKTINFPIIHKRF